METKRQKVVITAIKHSGNVETKVEGEINNEARLVDDPVAIVREIRKFIRDYESVGGEELGRFLSAVESPVMQYQGLVENMQKYIMAVSSGLPEDSKIELNFYIPTQ